LNEVILLASRYNRLNNQLCDGVVDQAFYNLELNKITKNLMLYYASTKP